MGKFSKEKDEQIVKMYKEGKNQVEIAEYFNTFNTSIRRVLLRHNIKVLTNSERQRKISPLFFNDYSNKNIQYWLGVIASDGCITKGKLIVETVDLDWMTDYRNFLNPDINILETQPPRGNLLYRVQVRSKGIVQELEKYGITNNKSLSLYWKYPLTWDFIRGIFDGDGCVTYTKNTKYVIVSFCGGSIKFLQQIQEFLLQNNIKSNLNEEKREDRILYYLHINFLEDKKKLYNFLYEKAIFFLKRKKEKFSNILNQNYPLK